MHELFVRTLSQGLQAFMPVAACVAYARAAGRRELIAAPRRAVAAAMPLTAVAGHLFQATAYQARCEAALAAAAVAIGLYAARGGWRRDARLAVAALVIVIVRQTMEIDAALSAAIGVRSSEAIAAVAGAALGAMAIAAVWTVIVARLPNAASRTALSMFAVVFVAQASTYTIHEASEAALLPWSGVIHAATEPYGPEGPFGRAISYLLVVCPLGAGLAALLRAKAPIVTGGAFRVPRGARAGAAFAALACVMLIAADRDTTRMAPTAAAVPSEAPSLRAITAAPHVVFRHAAVDQEYNAIGAAPLDRDARAAMSALRCERVSFAAGRGICLQAHRGFFTTYAAVLFDAAMTPTASLKLDGSPSRTRVSADGRVGAITVFTLGHAYAASSFSTKTTLVDMAAGEEIGDLEQFTTWRDGARVKAADFNFWGVTFTRDSNVFYASLGSGGKTYLVKGDLALRKLTVLHDNVECPSLSPDNRTIVFKRRVASRAGAWRYYVLDLETMTDRPLAAETRYVDDQAEWLDNDHVLYAVQRPSSVVSDVWVAPIDGNGSPTLYRAEAASPIVVR